MRDDISRIKEIKSKLGSDLLILAHHYQRDEIVALADAVGDSLKLAQIAQQNKKAKYIVFCGVHFMAETADILSEEYQRVFLPAVDAGCPMADMADREGSEKAWDIIASELGGNVIPITYVNSKAEVKAFCGEHGGTVVTSGNAQSVVKWGLENGDRVFFLPDQNLGRNTALSLGVKREHTALYDRKEGRLIYGCAPEDVRMILWDGFCHVHHRITPDIVNKARQADPEAKIVVHPECPLETVELCDGSGSTEYLINAVKNGAPGSRWIVGTEFNLVNRLKALCPDKDIKILDTASVCTNMSKTNTENLCDTLEQILAGDHSRLVTVDDNTAKNAVKALDKMLSLS